MEHHSNLIPWQQLAHRTGAVLHYLDLTAQGEITLAALKSAIGPKTRIVALSKISNVLGTINPVEEAGVLVHRQGGVLVVDGAQSVPHQPTDVQALQADFLAFSGHKMCGPTGIGVLWGRTALLERMEPTTFGGEMISYVDRDTATWAELPHKFEAGTPMIAEAVGLGVAAEYLTGVGMEQIAEHTQELTESAFHELSAVPGVTLYGPKRPHMAALAFNLDGIHPHDVAQVLDSQGVAIRAGHHCAQPLMQWLGVGSTARASFYFYNTFDDVERLRDALIETKRFFQR